MVLAPVVRGRKGEYRDLFEELRAEGFTRVKVDGELRRLEEEIALDKKYKHDISVVVDRLVMRPTCASGWPTRSRRRWRWPRASSTSRSVDTGEVTTYSERFACLHCGTSMPELEPRIFSFNSPHGACPRCTGLGSQMEIDPELVVPDPSLSLERGRDPAVVHERLELLRADDAGDRRHATRSTWTRRGRTCRRRSRTASSTAPTASASTSPTATATGAGART